MTLYDRVVDGRTGPTRLRVAATQRVDGDVHPIRVDPSTLAERQVAATGATWSMLDQTHGTEVVDLDPIDEAGNNGCRAVSGVGDVAHTDRIDRQVAMWSADCATVVLLSATGRLVTTHAGWRGLSDGVIDVAVEAAGRDPILAAVLGPLVHPCCYEFADDDRRAVERGVGAEPGALAATTSDGRPALDVPAAVAMGLRRRGVELDVVGRCTGCDDSWFSHRVRRDHGRHATVAWTSETTGTG